MPRPCRSPSPGSLCRHRRRRRKAPAPGPRGNRWRPGVAGRCLGMLVLGDEDLGLEVWETMVNPRISSYTNGRVLKDPTRFYWFLTFLGKLKCRSRLCLGHIRILWFSISMTRHFVGYGYCHYGYLVVSFFASTRNHGETWVLWK